MKSARCQLLVVLLIGSVAVWLHLLREARSYDAAPTYLDLQRQQRLTLDALQNDWANLARYRDANAKLAPPARNENRVVFSFRLNGIGTFGTEQIGQRFR